MTENLERLNDPRMEYYHSLYKNSPKWDGETSLFKKKVIIYCEQGLGDIIQMFRYVENLKKFGRPYVILHCPKDLGILLSKHEFVDEIIDKDFLKDLPDHDCHILSLSLPYLLSKNNKTKNPYILFEEKNPEINTQSFKIGIAWEGNKTWDGREKGILLKYFEPLTQIGDVFMLQKDIVNPALLQGADEFPLLGLEIKNFVDTAKIINSMDLVVTVDTCILHLAGALNKKTYGLLDNNYDPRWDIKVWYPSVKLLKVDNDWNKVFNKIVEDIKNG